MRIFLPHLMLLGISLTLGCKPRGSDLSYRDELASILNLAEADLATRIDVCSRKIMMMYVGNAEGLGDITVVPAARQRFSDRALLGYAAMDEQREEEYFVDITSQRNELMNRVKRINDACNNTLKDIVAAGKTPGTFLLVSLVDGPNHGVAADSALHTLNLRFDNNGWFPEERSWSIRNGQIVEGKGVFESFIPRDLGLVNRWAVEFFAGTTQNQAPEQTIYALKSHGSRRPIPIINSLYPTLLDMTAPRSFINESVFMFDRHDERGLRAQSSYFAPLWSPTGICKWLADLKDAELDRCIAKLQEQNSFQVVNREKGGVATKQTQGRAEETQGRAEETQGLGDRGNPIFSVSVPNQDIDPLSALTVGPAIWSEKTQGLAGSDLAFGGRGLNQTGKSQEGKQAPYRLNFPLTEDMISRIRTPYESLEGFPEAFRLMGDGITISEDPNAEYKLELIAGSKYTSMVLLDTCSANTSSFDKADKVSRRMVPFANQVGDPKFANDFVVISNPLPLLIDAVNYGVLDSFQQSWLATLIAAGSNSQTDNPGITNLVSKAVKVLMVEETLYSDERMAFNRLKVEYFKCRMEGSNPACNQTKPMHIVYDHQEMFLALEKLEYIFKQIADNPHEEDFPKLNSAISAFTGSAVSYLLGNQPESMSLTQFGAFISNMRLAMGFLTGYKVRRMFMNQTAGVGGIIPILARPWAVYTSELLQRMRTVGNPTSLRPDILVTPGLEDVIYAELYQINLFMMIQSEIRKQLGFLAGMAGFKALPEVETIVAGYLEYLSITFKNSPNTTEVKTVLEIYKQKKKIYDLPEAREIINRIVIEKLHAPFTKE